MLTSSESPAVSLSRQLCRIACSVFVVIAGRASFGEARPPNVLLIVADDLGWSDLACYGNSLHSTRHLDRLAKQGVRFTDAYAAAAICSPTRASILTGRFPTRLHLTEFIPGRRYPHAKLVPPKWTRRLVQEELTIAEFLQRKGYATAAIGKWHLGGEGHSPQDQGFDKNIAGTQIGYPRSYFSPYDNPQLQDGPEGEHLPIRLSREAVGLMEQYREQSFFLYVSYFSVHLPIQPSLEKLAKYEKRLRDRPAEKGEHNNPHYAAMVESLDDGVGILLDGLERLNLADETIVIFLSDHGGLSTLEGEHTPATTNHPLRMGKGYLYEGGIRVPLIVRWPGNVRAAKVCETPVISDDLFPTIVEAIGCSVDEAATNGGFDGVSFLDHLRTPTELRTGRNLCWHYPHYPRQGSRPAGAVRAGDWKLIEHYEDGSLELFDLATDIGETTNLATEQPTLVTALRDKLHSWRETVGAQMPTPNPDYDPDHPLRDAYWRAYPFH